MEIESNIESILNATDIIRQRAQELRSYNRTINQKVQGMEPEEARDYLRGMASVFKTNSGQYSRTKKGLMNNIIDNYADTFQDKNEGYLRAWIDTGIFPGQYKLPIEYAMEHLPLQTISWNYAPSIDNVASLLKKFTPKAVAETYIRQRKKEDVVLSLIYNGVNREELKSVGIKNIKTK